MKNKYKHIFKNTSARSKSSVRLIYYFSGARCLRVSYHHSFTCVKRESNAHCRWPQPLTNTHMYSITLYEDEYYHVTSNHKIIFSNKYNNNNPSHKPTLLFPINTHTHLPPLPLVQTFHNPSITIFSFKKKSLSPTKNGRGQSVAFYYSFGLILKFLLS